MRVIVVIAELLRSVSTSLCLTVLSSCNEMTCSCIVYLGAHLSGIRREPRKHKDCCHFYFPHRHIKTKIKIYIHLRYPVHVCPQFSWRFIRPKGAATSGGCLRLRSLINHCQQLNIQSEGPCQCHVRSNWWEDFSSFCLIRLNMSNISPSKIFYLPRAKQGFYRHGNNLSLLNTLFKAKQMNTWITNNYN